MESHLAKRTHRINHSGRTQVKRQDSNSFGIWMAAENCESAVYLLGQNHAGEFMRHRQHRERNALRGPCAKLGGKTHGVATEKNKLSRTAVAHIAEPARELLRRKLPSSSVEQNYRCARLDLQSAQRGGRSIT